MQQMKKVVTMYGPHLLFTKKLLNAMASSIRNFVPYDWWLLIRALLKPREYLQWTMWFQDVAQDHANSNAWAGTPQNQIAFEMLTSTGQFDTMEGQIQSPPWWKTILTVIVIVILFLLFAFYIYNYIMNFVSKWLRHLSYKWLFMLWQFPQPPLALRAPGSETLSVRIRRICCLNNLLAGRSYRTISPPFSLATVFF